MENLRNNFLYVIVALLFAVGLPFAGRSAPVSAGGGDIIYDIQEGDIPYRVHVFTNTGPAMLTVSNGGFVECLVVGGGGGGGGGAMAGGGGGGGVIFMPSVSITSGVYAVTVGAGGLGGYAYNKSYQAGVRGEDSTFGEELVALGGGGGCGWTGHPSTSGGSGGGGNSSLAASPGTDGQGHAGAIGSSALDQRSAGGGGGAGEPGGLGVAGAGGKGGDGRAIFGHTYGGGGGGGLEGTPLDTAGGGPGGLGGGGAGSRGSTKAMNAVPNTGGGGGGAGFTVASSGRLGGNGGSGIVIIRYATGPMTPVPDVTLADAVTGSEQFTSTNGVKITAFPAYGGYNKLQCTGESHSILALDDAKWVSTNDLAEYCITFDRPMADTNIALYVWYTNTTETAKPLLRSVGQITYTSVAPVPAVRSTLIRERLPEATIIIHAADIDIGSSAGVANGINMSFYVRKVVAVNPADDLTPDEPYVTLPSADGNYPLALWLQNEAGNTITSLATTCTVATVSDSNTRVCASGGDVVYGIQEGDIPYQVHVFTNVGPAMLTLSNSVFLDYLLVGGGGGGGETIGGGGGGGGVRTIHGLSVTSGVYAVTVGAGGAGGWSAVKNIYPAGKRGDDSTFDIWTAAGGGAGGGFNVAALGTGGSAGGNGGGGGARAGYTVGQGSDGGVHWNDNAGGGGGGAGATGASALATGGGGGGNGRQESISGVSTYYGGGGGGGTRNTTGPAAGMGGLGGGGDGGRTTAGQNGAANTGGGGGGGGFISDLAGGAGGTGIVIVRYVSGSVVPTPDVTLADANTGSERFTNTNGVKITAFPAYDGYDQFQCTGESRSILALDANGWVSTNNLAEYYATFERWMTDTNITLYVWFTNTTDTAKPLLRSAGQITYTSVDPVPVVRPTLKRERLPGTNVVVTVADLDIGSNAGVADGMDMAMYARKAVAVNPGDDLTPDEPYVTFGAAGVYQVKLWLQNEAGNIILSAATCIVSVTDAVSDTNNWTGAGLTKLWSEGANWSAGLPASGQNVAITGATDAVTLDATCPSLALFTMTAGTLTFTNWATCLRAETVELRGGTVTLPSAFKESDMSNRVWIVCEKDFMLGTNAVINANALGYQAMNGLGKGVGGGGGGYGGRGGMDYYGTPGGLFYGVASEPIAVGSGGGTSVNFGLGGYGGGAVRIEALGRVIVNGTIMAKGGDGTIRSGGGSGGGIYIVCDTFGGTGLIQANGGGSSAGRGGGGGGGRIAVAYTQSASVQAVRFSTLPGTGWEFGIYEQDVMAGTVWLSQADLLAETMTDWRFAGVRLYVEGLTAWDVNSLTVSNCSFAFAEEGFRLTVTNNLRIDTNGSLGLGDSGNTSCVELACGGDLTLTHGGSLFVYSGETNASTSYGALVSVSNTLSVGSGSWVHVFSHPSSGESPLFRMRSLAVEGGANGGFNADGKGYRSEYGPGRGITGREGGSGGGYGGQGGTDYYSHKGGSFYGSTNEPFAAGSSGGAMTAWSEIGGYGGGAVRIEALEDVVLNGTITANGGKGTGRSGGGSGGGVYIVCDTFSGTEGRIQANGGISPDRGGGGGGGRIAVWYKMPEWVRAQVRAGSIPNSVLITNVCSKYSGQLSVEPGTGWKSLPDPTGAYPGTVVFLRYRQDGTMFILR